MKLLSIYRPFYLLFFLSYCISSAQNDPFGEDDPFGVEDMNLDHRPRQIRVYTESYEISALEYATLMTTPINKSNHDNLRDKLFEKVKNKTAKLINNQSIIIRSGERGTIESIREYIYPTEAMPADGLPKNIAEKKQEQPAKIFPFNPATPTAFQTRNIGYTLVAEATLGDDDETIDLNLSPEMVKHIGDHVISEWNTPFAKFRIAKPIFYTKRLATAVTVKDGEFLLANTYSPEKDGKPDHSRKILHFVRAEILVVGEEK